MVAHTTLFAISLATGLLLAQTAPDAAIPETTTHDSPITFQSKVNLVPVPVVVRDKKSHAIGSLTKESFQLFDNGKLQTISKFSVEKSTVDGDVNTVPANGPEGVPVTEGARKPPVIANRFVAYVFDDVHFNTADLMQARAAALKHFDTIENISSRAAVYTTSGIGAEDFTSDREKLKAALNKLTTRSRALSPQSDCPYIGYYLADQIVNHNDAQALQSAATDAMSCPSAPPTLLAAQAQIRSTAFQALNVGESETRGTLLLLSTMVRRLASMPGQRTLVLVSPGFVFPTHEQEVTELIDLAIRRNVVINAIDGRGLYVDSRYDASRSHVQNPIMTQYATDEAQQSGDTLGAISEGTGGTFFHNSNDLLAGFHRTASQPEFTYMLGFSPQNLKNDGKYHSIKVKLKESSGFTIQARRGYFAPKQSASAADRAKQDIEDAMFSREEINEFPLTISTQFFKTSDVLANLSIVARIGLKPFHFRKAEGRNNDQLTIVTGLFDRDGNFMSGKQTNVDLHFRDETLARHINNGVAIRTSFDNVKPGSYVLRLVARDSEGQMISAANGSIEVP